MGIYIFITFPYYYHLLLLMLILRSASRFQERHKLSRVET